MKIGILGGSFDPVHLGHLHLAEDAITQAGLDQVVMVPARIQPFKQDRTPASGEDRIRMIALAAGQNDHITPSRFELEHDGVSYTYITLNAMKERYDELARKRGEESADMYFICGTDSLLKIHTWMHADEFLPRYTVIVGSRPGYREQELAEHMIYLKEKYGTKVIHITNRQFNISSTEIRERASRGLPLDDLIPAEVARYISEKGLYR